MSEPLKFFADVHIPARAIEQLQKKGVDIVRSLDMGFVQDEQDVALFEYAIQNNCIMITCDGDYLDFHNDYQAKGQEHAGIIYFDTRTGHCGDIGHVVETIFYYHEIILVGGGTYTDDLYNQVKFH